MDCNEAPQSQAGLSHIFHLCSISPHRPCLVFNLLRVTQSRCFNVDLWTGTRGLCMRLRLSGFCIFHSDSILQIRRVYCLKELSQSGVLVFLISIWTSGVNLYIHGLGETGCCYTLTIFYERQLCGGYREVDVTNYWEPLRQCRIKTVPDEEKLME